MNDLGERWIFCQNLVGRFPLIPICSDVHVFQGTYGRYTYAAPAAHGATPPINVRIFIYNSLPHCTVLGAGREKL